jgi:hypothetical protein
MLVLPSTVGNTSNEGSVGFSARQRGKYRLLSVISARREDHHP